MKNAMTTMGLALFGLLFLSMSAGAQSDGTTSSESPTDPSIPNYPGLPPNSGDIVYDSGDYTGQARNLQNADIIPGWPYWAHQVRFTPTPSMQGELLEVRYVASTQWGTTTNFDLFIRNSAGVVVASLPGLTAVIDSGNWQIIDVSSLNFRPAFHGSDFYVELQPATQCNGVNGFTIPYSQLGSGRSAFTSDCTNPFGSFVVEGRDLFIRAVVELNPTGSWTDLGHGLAGTGGVTPLLVGTGTLSPGTPATLTLSNALPNSQAWLFIGLTQVNVAFRGGILVPSNDFLVPALPVNGSGGLVIGTNWPALPSGTAVYFQYWVVDPAGPFGASASNGLMGTTQ